MSIQKKSLISNRVATKKANLTKVNATPVATTKLAKPATASKATVSAVNSKLGPKFLVKPMISPKPAVKAQVSTCSTKW